MTTVPRAVIIIIIITAAASKPRAGGWDNPNPGWLAWHTPAGRTYTTTPTRYAA